MSTDATQWAWKVQGVNVSQKVILLSLADRANEQHECWPSMKRLMYDTGIKNKQTIINNIKALERMGLLLTLREHGYSNRYRLVGVQGRDEGGTKIGTSTKIATSPKIGTRGGTKIGTGVVPKLVHESKKNLKENLEENIYSGKSVSVEPVVDPVEAVAEQLASTRHGLEWSQVDKAVVDFVESFVAYVKTEHPNLAPEATPKFVRQSIEAVDKLMRLDGFSLDDIQDAMRFAVRDAFWAKNTLSLCGLRKKGDDGRTKFQKILAAMEHAEVRANQVGQVGQNGNVGQGMKATTVAQQEVKNRDAIAAMLNNERRKNGKGQGSQPALQV